MVSGSTASELTRLSNSVVIPKANSPRGAGFASFEAPAWASNLPSILESLDSSSVEICAIQVTYRIWFDVGQGVLAGGPTSGISSPYLMLSMWLEFRGFLYLR